MKKILILSLFLCGCMASVPRKRDFSGSFRVFETAGRSEITLEMLASKAKDADVVFLGENHDDEVGHFVEFEILKAIHPLNGNVSLALEFFDRDVQVVMNEYLAGLITEDHFLRSSRPPSNYKSAYRPMVEYSKENNIPVIAANVPRRYVNMTTRMGVESLERLSEDAGKWLPPLPYSLPEGRYLEKLKKNAEKMEAALARKKGGGAARMRSVVMRHKKAGAAGFANHGLWDAGMAYSISETIKKRGGPVVMVNGCFHTDERMGILLQLNRYSPRAKSVVVTIKPVDDIRAADPEPFFKLGDYVVLTNAK